MKKRQLDWFLDAEELANLSDNWENSKVDTRYYFEGLTNIFEVSKEIYENLKKEGFCCQVCNGKFYVGA